MTRIEEIKSRAGRDFIYDPFNYRDDVLYLLSEVKRMREALEGLLLGIEKTAGRHNPAVRDASEKARAAIKGIEP